MRGPVEDDVRRLRPWGVGWRLGVAAAAFAMLAVGQIADTNDLFPLGSLSQYATARDMNGVVHSVYLAAELPGGDVVHIPLSQSVVGVGRAEIEGQLGRIIADPSLLQGLADAHAALRPNAPQPEQLFLQRRTHQLADGVRVGDPAEETLAQWAVLP